MGTWGTVPFDDGFPDAERAGQAPLDFAPDAAAIEAISEIAQRWAGNGNGRA